MCNYFSSVVDLIEMESSVKLSSLDLPAKIRWRTINEPHTFTNQLPFFLSLGEWKIELKSVHTSNQTLRAEERTFHMKIRGCDNLVQGIISENCFSNMETLLMGFREEVNRLLLEIHVDQEDSPVISLNNGFLQWISQNVTLANSHNYLSHILGFDADTRVIDSVIVFPVSWPVDALSPVIHSSTSFYEYDCTTILAEVGPRWEANRFTKFHNIKLCLKFWLNDRFVVEAFLTDDEGRIPATSANDFTEILCRVQRPD